MFIAALFIIDKTGKVVQMFLVSEQISEVWYLQIMEYYSVLKRNELSGHEKTYTNLKMYIIKWQKSIWKKLGNVLFQLHDILEKANLWRH